MDTVHQGNHDGQAGLYHINAVDTVTQWQVLGGVETISERHLIPVLEAMLHQFAFRIRGFHCDKGSEFLNHSVARLLNKLLIEFTKSRLCRTTGNALVEGNDGAVVRSWISGSFLDWKMLEEAPGRSGKQQPPGGVDQCVGHHGGADAAGFLIGQAVEQPGDGRHNGEAPVGK